MQLSIMGRNQLTIHFVAVCNGIPSWSWSFGVVRSGVDIPTRNWRMTAARCLETQSSGLFFVFYEVHTYG